MGHSQEALIAGQKYVQCDCRRQHHPLIRIMQFTFSTVGRIIYIFVFVIATSYQNVLLYYNNFVCSPLVTVFLLTQILNQQPLLFYLLFVQKKKNTNFTIMSSNCGRNCVTLRLGKTYLSKSFIHPYLLPCQVILPHVRTVSRNDVHRQQTSWNLLAIAYGI